ncbi:class I SAM-dependent DNA methyltransferase [Sphingomonas sp. RHCKR47]|uniref:class I SAM-dependent DNA methyltransferase n=1 Tax=Sphingomonas citricola TaxID=2862498 RepID=UPI001CA4830C|nr:DNA methyltransferase [Sphingomonas citricola]MBW6523278.1 class I SAM-dependent DNA methyltransferase [Sphingomonas citricola]
MGESVDAEQFIAEWRSTGGSELANTQSFINDLCRLIGVEPPRGSRTDDTQNDYVFERRVFQDNGDGTVSFGRIDCYKRGAFILEAKQGSEADRAAAERGEEDLDLFGQTASARLKRGTARRGTPGWAKAMVQAKGQAERYAKALPADHGWPPFLLIADIGYCIEVYADFSGTGKSYAQFPDRSRYRIMLDDLRDPEVRERLAAIWDAPASLDPAARAARVTRDIADLLATVARRLEKRGHTAERTSGFLMRLLFTMFAEDSGLIPEKSFTNLLKAQRAAPQHLEHQLTALWAAMDAGEFSPALGVPLRKFNGYLFKDRTAIPLDAEELEVLIQAAEHRWTEVEPAIFGTLLERALNPKERAKLGAHYTPRAYVERLVGPTIIEPLRADWAGVRVAASELIDQGRAEEARRTVETFHTRLAQTRVLDPACGTGNFLYVAMARMKELEGEVLDLLVDLGDDQYLAELTGHTITPENFLGIEINPRAAAIAQLVLWIGYLQWHFRVNGADRPPPEPILRDIRTIENRDALLDWDERVLERDERGAPVTRWDGETMKPHPVTGKPVPDEAARVEVYRYVKPRAAKWPKADFIVGNPPFIGNKRMRERLSAGYVEALRKVYAPVPSSIDFVMYWWWRASRSEKWRRFGFITTNSISQAFNRPVLDGLTSGRIVFAIANHPWIDAGEGADVRIAMTVCSRDDGSTLLEEVTAEEPIPGGQGERAISTIRQVGVHISGGLRTGANVHEAKALRANVGLACPGVQLSGQGFIVDWAMLSQFSADDREMFKRYLTGSELNARPKNRWVIDTFGFSEMELRRTHPAVYQYLVMHVLPERSHNPRPKYAREWWLHAEPRARFRKALEGVSRFAVSSRTSKHRTFEFIESSVLPETKVLVIALQDYFHLGVLISKFHVHFSNVAGSRLGVGDDPTYNHSDCFDPFPFPGEVPEIVKNRIRAEAEALDALRKRVLAEHDDLTLTKLYNVLETLRDRRVLSPQERDIHDRGLVTLIRQHHDAIDEGVADAYGWGDAHRAGTLDEETILTRLVALNKERATEEARGLVRYLRPEFQDPGYRAPVAATLDLGEAAVAPISNVIPWPATLPEQVGAVQSILAAAPAPLGAADIARSFKGKRAATVRPVLDALAGLGMARRLNDGRYAA